MAWNCSDFNLDVCVCVSPPIGQGAAAWTSSGASRFASGEVWGPSALPLKKQPPVEQVELPNYHRHSFWTPAWYIYIHTHTQSLFLIKAAVFKNHISFVWTSYICFVLLCFFYCFFYLFLYVNTIAIKSQHVSHVPFNSNINPAQTSQDKLLASNKWQLVFM